MTITHFSIDYDSINSQNIFTNGDTINGRIIVEVSKETSIQSLTFVGKGSAKVRWHERHGKHDRFYWSNEEYYEIKQHILKADTAFIAKGRHVFPFSFMVPNRKMPSSFKSTIGRIVHKLKAELKQSMKLKLTKKAKAHFTFVPKADMDIPGLMEPQHDCTDKKLSVFGSGTIAMDAYTKKMGYKPGEDLQVKVEIHNHASRDLKPKFVLYEKQSFFAQGHRRLHTQDIVKDKLDTVDARSKETAEKRIRIPTNLPPSILNSAIIKLEYRLKIFLDVKYAIDPKIKLPIVVLPAFEFPARNQPPGPVVYGFEDFGNKKQQSWSEATQPSDLPPPYGAHTQYPSLSRSEKYGS
ncbi:arrestin domain-containing protein 3-like isoform X1 [Phyllopteryx taeniolatus]|uniref:arrestin domain-containing protein 3-like isoform X1 n=1 Tax=Phyllopteryx taeniolatus TaxID=161469 RepID=UPI002AD49EF3|nr:arrestin domain-containing protein 3-like isoform X1 [Phyllopteryx taeniolatus]XP_061623999.1 arrestin domain-containing protein 3-like isoform X1 [Phyllopteryx taeniolatus]